MRAPPDVEPRKGRISELSVPPGMASRSPKVQAPSLRLEFGHFAVSFCRKLLSKTLVGWLPVEERGHRQELATKVFDKRDMHKVQTPGPGCPICEVAGWQDVAWNQDARGAMPPPPTGSRRNSRLAACATDPTTRRCAFPVNRPGDFPCFPRGFFQPFPL